MSLLQKHGMVAQNGDDYSYLAGFNNALKLSDAALEEAVHALKRSFYEADAIASGRNQTFVCAPVIRDYCRKALAELGETI